MTQATKPVKLQINTSGAWKDVVNFDAGNDQVSAQVIAGAADLGQATNARFRIVMLGSPPLPLSHFSPATGWKPWKAVTE